MDFAKLLEIVGDEPVFETALLLAGEVDAADVRRQLTRWRQAGRLHQLRRGLYALAPPFRKVLPHLFLVANRLVRASYVSLQSALAYHDLIPEQVPRVTSMTTGRPGRWDTPMGAFEFRHLKLGLFDGFRLIEVAPGQQAFVALPEKALLDLVHLQAGADTENYLRELRLQNLERLDGEHLQALAEGARSPKLMRVARQVAALAREEKEGYESL